MKTVHHNPMYQEAYEIILGMDIIALDLPGSSKDFVLSCKQYTRQNTRQNRIFNLILEKAIIDGPLTKISCEIFERYSSGNFPRGFNHPDDFMPEVFAYGIMHGWHPIEDLQKIHFAQESRADFCKKYYDSNLPKKLLEKLLAPGKKELLASGVELDLESALNSA